LYNFGQDGIVVRASFTRSKDLIRIAYRIVLKDLKVSIHSSFLSVQHETDRVDIKPTFAYCKALQNISYLKWSCIWKLVAWLD